MFLSNSSGPGFRRVLALADDLSGAAETAAALGLHGTLVLSAAGAGACDDHAGAVARGRPDACHAHARSGAGDAPWVVVADLDSRWLPPAEAAGSVHAALAGACPGTMLFKKADSLLRGNISAEAVAYAAGAHAVVTALALPVAGRTVRDGVVHLPGGPLHRTDAWRAEGRAAPASVADALHGLVTEGVPLDRVRRGPGPLTDRLRDVAARGLHPVCDAETDDDLDTIAEAVLLLGPEYRPLGTSALAAALWRRSVARPGHQLAGTGRDHVPAAGAGRPLEPGGGTERRPVLVVVGTAEPTATAQIAQLTAVGARHVAVSPDLLRRAGQGRTPEVPLVPGRVTVLGIDGSGGLDPGASVDVAAGLGRVVAMLRTPADLVLTGGETARRVLDALGVRELAPLREIHHGAVHSRTPDGRAVVIRPGSFGGIDSLLSIARALGADLPPHR
ncbi:four-carbon acid sugar kinase family protein [Streptomyces sp. VNUA24]|uniref:four-carbon acid sugar kinase family protein n=1 Tax=Streptomyces sp. VNUA24 TaxID=3031131 RepID=UPI0023B79C9E|nr:four-carbon acid sugar kinase family protein [Streptomyces sp. VNUA24]WEH12871.1 four-carbon acid sugar kinase family protein [Streptomyces sp. VNUA24]